MRKYEDVDVIAALGAVMEINTEHYKSDFKYDIEMFQKAAAEPNGNNNHLIWFSRQSGTECFIERNTHIKDTAAYSTCLYHAGTQDNIRAYAVDITGMEGGTVKGNLYELDLIKFVERLEKEAQQPTEVTLYLADGTEKSLPYDKYQVSWTALNDRYGKIDKVRFEVADENSLQQLMKHARNERQKNTPSVFKLRNTSRKPSIREQLSEGKGAAVQKKEASHKKLNKKEVSI